MLHADHLRAGKELQRKIEALRGENKDPSLPQKPLPLPPVANVDAVRQLPQPVPSPPPSGRRMTDSQNAGEESFMLLGHRVRISSSLVVRRRQSVSFPSSQIPVTPSISSGKYWRICWRTCRSLLHLPLHHSPWVIYSQRVLKHCNGTAVSAATPISRNRWSGGSQDELELAGTIQRSRNHQACPNLRVQPR